MTAFKYSLIWLYFYCSCDNGIFLAANLYLLLRKFENVKFCEKKKKIDTVIMTKTVSPFITFIGLKKKKNEPFSYCHKFW